MSDLVQTQSLDLRTDGPIPVSQRIESIDVLRGLVLLGILLMNIPLFGLPHWVGKIPSIGGGIEGIQWWTFVGLVVLVDGKMRALFSMLFGAGAVLLTRRAESSGPEGRASAADIYYRRMLWLILFGLIDGFVLGWFGDILYWYGVAGLVLYPLRKARPRNLIIAALLFLLVGVVQHAIHRNSRIEKRAEVATIRADIAGGKPVTDEQKKKVEAFDEHVKELIPSPEKIKAEVDARRGGYISALVATAPICKKWNSGPLFLDSDVIPMMLLGVAFANAGIITGKRSTRFYVIAALVCLPLGWYIAALQPLAWSRANFDVQYITTFGEGAAWGYPTQRLLLAIGYLSVVMLIVRAGIFRSVLRGIAAAGRMPLTNYLGQSIICLFLFTGAGFAMFDRFTKAELSLMAFVIWLLQVFFSLWWLRTHPFGPMEWVWRWLAYRQCPAWKHPT